MAEPIVKFSLAACRVNAGLDQKEAATSLNISNGTLCKWEKGESFPSAEKIPEICDLYGVPYDYIDFLRYSSLKVNEEDGREDYGQMDNLST